MRIPARKRPAFYSETMTPMIDVVFLLLVFFVCASIGQKPDTLLPAELSDGNTETEIEVAPLDSPELPPQEVRIQLTTDPDGQLVIQLNEGSVSGPGELRERLQRLAELDARSCIVLDVADDVSVQQFIAVYDLCQVLRFESISFAVRQ